MNTEFSDSCSYLARLCSQRATIGGLAEVNLSFGLEDKPLSKIGSISYTGYLYTSSQRKIMPDFGRSNLSAYNFYSILLPGIIFMLGLFPFLPEQTPVNTIGVLLPLLAGGFAFGQAIHTIGVRIERSSKATKQLRKEIKSAEKCTTSIKLRARYYAVAVPFKQVFGEQYFLDTSHRTLFQKELTSSSESKVVDEKFLDNFYDVCADVFEEIELPDERTEIGSDDLTDSLYSTIRSITHMDGRGRSRTFQAVYAFCRSMWITSIILFGVYGVYAVLKALGILSSVAGYTSFIGSLNISSPLILLTGVIASLISFKIFRRAKSDYQKVYIEYLFTDFLVIQNERFKSQQFVDVSVSNDPP